MGCYRFSYQTIVSYRSPIHSHHFLLRCTPRDEAGQRVMQLSCDLLSSARIYNSKDIFGNDIIYGSMLSSHDLFVVAIGGVVECGRYAIADSNPQPIFQAASHFTHIDPPMSQFGATISSDGSPRDQAMALSDAIFNNMKYTPGATTTETTAIESFALGEGVCQDYAHQLIAMARARGIKARYVAGLLVGTGESHAWVEIHSHGEWHGIDPTHNCLVEEGYIKLSHGRDAADCSVSRGVHRGGAVEHTTQVQVVVERVY